MKTKADEILPTRASLLVRLKDWQDDRSWTEFFDTYWPLIYGVASKAGLSNSEAQDVVQEVFVSVSKNIGDFDYDPLRGSFKGWLLKLTRWRILGQFRKRKPEETIAVGHSYESEQKTTLMQRLADPNALVQDELWEKEWQRTLLEKGLENLKRKLDPLRYQVFDCCVHKEWPAQKISEAFNVSVDQVYQIKHRVTEALREEVLHLEMQHSAPAIDRL